MADLASRAQTATDRLATLSEAELYAELGKRLMLLQQEPDKSAGFDLSEEIKIEAFGPFDVVSDFGRRYFHRVNGQAYALICGSDSANSKDRQKLAQAFGIGQDAVAPALAALLVLHLGLAPLVAAALGVLVVRLFYKPGYDAMCEVWKINIDTKAS